MMKTLPAAAGVGGFRSQERTRSAAPKLPLHPRLLFYAVVAAACVLCAVTLSRLPQSPNLAWFIAVDAGITAFAFATGAISLAYFRGFGARSLLFVSIGFLGAAVLQGVHLTLQFELAPFSLAPRPHSAEAASAITSQAYLGVMLIIGWRAREWRISPTPQRALGTSAVALVSGLALLAVASGMIVLSEAILSPMAVSLLWAASAVTGLLYLVSLLSFVAAGDWRTHGFQHGFILLLLLILGSHAVIALGGPRLSDPVLLGADILRCVAFATAFLTLLGSTTGLADQVSELRLEARIQSLLENQEALAVPSGRSAKAIPIAHRLQGVGTFELDLVSGQFRGSPVTARIFGSSAGLENVQQFRNHVHPDDAQKLLHALDHSKRAGGLFKERFRVRTPDGDRWLEAVAAVEALSGQAPRLIGFVDDITVQIELEHERDRLHAELEQMIAAVDQHAATATLAPDGTIETVNPLFCEACGETADALCGRRLGELIHTVPGTPDLPRNLHNLDPDSSWRGEVQVALPDGSNRIAQASITPHRVHGGEHDKLVYVAFDVTQRVEAEKALIESVTAHRKSNEDLQMFAHIVSHDLQEPLRMVSSFMSLLERRYADQLADEAREFIQFAVEGAHRMRALLDGLLEYSRVSSRGGAFEPVELGEPVAGALDNLRMLIEESGAEITVGSLPELCADPAQMIQLFQNLLSNAVKFCPDRTPRIRIDARREGGRTVVTVSDNGIGIDPAHYDRIFQIFQRLHGRGEYPGSGVGLAVCKRIMERHGGNIEMESILGEGTAFHLEFPTA